MHPYLSLALDLAQTAGSILRQNFNQHIPITWKADASAVTKIDQRVNQLIINTISKAYPSHAIISEEGNYGNTEESEYLWVCDPIDGTIAYSHGVPTATISIALTHHHEMIVAVVYDPFLDRLFYAAKGSGAFVNNTRINVSTTSSLRQSMIGIPMWKHFAYPYSTVLSEQFIERDAFLLNTCAIVYLGILTAAGKIDAAIYLDNKPYDAAAIKLIVEEAGGTVTDLYGNDQPYDTQIKGCVLSNGHLHETIITAIKKYITA